MTDEELAITVDVTNSPTLAVLAEAKNFNLDPSMTAAAYMAEAAIASSGLRANLPQTPTDHAALLHEAKNARHIRSTHAQRLDLIDRLAAALEASRSLTPSHWECNCVPDLGPTHCHACSDREGRPVTWADGHPLTPSADVRAAIERQTRIHQPLTPDLDIIFAAALTPETGDVREALVSALTRLGVSNPFHGADTILREFIVTSKGTPETDEGNR